MHTQICLGTDIMPYSIKKNLTWWLGPVYRSTLMASYDYIWTFPCPVYVYQTCLKEKKVMGISLTFITPIKVPYDGLNFRINSIIVNL